MVRDQTRYFLSPVEFLRNSWPEKICSPSSQFWITSGLLPVGHIWTSSSAGQTTSAGSWNKAQPTSKAEYGRNSDYWKHQLTGTFLLPAACPSHTSFSNDISQNPEVLKLTWEQESINPPFSDREPLPLTWIWQFSSRLLLLPLCWSQQSHAIWGHPLQSVYPGVLWVVGKYGSWEGLSKINYYEVILTCILVIALISW